MKTFKSLLAELSNQTAVFVFGRMNPISSGHSLVIEKANQIAREYNTESYIYLSHSVDVKKNPLDKDKKMYWARKFFPSTNIVESDARTFLDAAKELNKKHNKLIMIAGSDRVQEYQEKLDKYNGIEYRYESIEVISAGERDPDANDVSSVSATMLREHVANAEFDQFKKNIPPIIDVEARRYFNDIREAMQLEPITQRFQFARDMMREKYISGNLFEVGDIVESNNSLYEILSLGTNYVTVVQNGITSRKWLNQLKASDTTSLHENKVVDNVVQFKGYYTQNFNKEIAHAFQSLIESEKDAIAILTAIKATDTYLDKNTNMITFKESFERAKEYLSKLDVIDEHAYMLEYAALDEVLSRNIRTTNKLEVARIIGTFLSVDDVETMVVPEQIVNLGLKNMKRLPANRENKKILARILELARNAKISFDTKLIPAQLNESEDDDEKKSKKDIVFHDTDDDEDEDEEGKVGASLDSKDDDNVRRQKVKHQLGEDDKHVDIGVGIDDDEYDLTDDEIDSMIAHIDDWDDIIDAYDDDEFEYIDDETEEVLSDDDFEYIDESMLSEVMSRQERIRARLRMRKTKSKRERGARLALKRYSSAKVINRRSRRLAVNMLKKRMAQGRDPKTLSVGEKERLERQLKKRKSTIDRIAMKMISRVRQTEKKRMSSARTKR